MVVLESLALIKLKKLFYLVPSICWTCCLPLSQWHTHKSTKNKKSWRKCVQKPRSVHDKRQCAEWNSSRGKHKMALKVKATMDAVQIYGQLPLHQLELDLELEFLLDLILEMEHPKVKNFNHDQLVLQNHVMKFRLRLNNLHLMQHHLGL